jgi:hypothetical protein
VADFSIKWLIDVESAQIERTALPKACLKVDFLWLRHNSQYGVTGADAPTVG